MEFIKYNSSTGEITANGSCPDGEESKQALEGEDVLVGQRSDELTQYVVNDAIVDKPSMDTVHTDTTITNIPLGAELYIDDVLVETINDGEAELLFDTPGTYIIKLSVFPYLDEEYTIDAD